MTGCRVCSAKTDGFLCRKCGDEIADALGDMRSLLYELSVVVLRQSRVFRSTDRKTPETERIDPEAYLPAMLRSKDGRIALRATTMPVDLDASALLTVANNTLTTWARHLCESREVREWPTAAQLPTWLTEHAETWRYDEAGAEAHAHITDLRNAMERAVDRQPPKAFAGQCDAADVKIDALLLAGAPCTTLTCAHQSCEEIRRGVARLSPRPAVCGVDLYVGEGQSTITCEACGATYDVVKRHQELAEKIDDEWARPHTIARALSTLANPIKADTLRKWIERDARTNEQGRIVTRTLILQVGVDDGGNALYRVGDVRARINEVREVREAGRVA